MTDSTNNIDINALRKKYTDVLELFNDKKEIHKNDLAIIFEICINYIKQNFADIDIQIKILTIFVIKELYFKQKIITDTDMINTINEFINHYKQHYSDFIYKYEGSNINNINILFGNEFVKDKLT